MNVEKMADILETSSEKDGRISALGCQHLSITSYLFQKEMLLRDPLKASYFYKSNACKSLPHKILLGFLLTRDPGSTRVVGAFYLATGKL